jgi:Kef-type K+ transport system membrane component KefB
MGLEIYYKFILTFALVLLAARIGGELVERYLKQPAVLGELVAGIVISPFALGGLFHDPIILNFALIKGAFGLNEFSPMEIISQIAIVALLFVAGVETDVRAFIRNMLAGSIVALGGAVLSFIFGFLVTMTLYRDSGLAGWLFMGTIFTATSIGVTVRILTEMGRLQTKPGIVTLVAAVVDDVIGIVVLSVVVSVARAGSVDLLSVISVLVMGFGIWLVLLIVGVRFNQQISSYLLSPFRKSGTLPFVAMLIGFVAAYLVTLINLSPVVGAYMAGLVFAATAEREEIIEVTRPIALFLAPFFFAYLGMQVKLPTLFGHAASAGIMVIAAILGKLIGCYIPARLVGKLRHRGGMIVGVAMVPRAEVALIIAGAGLLTGAISREMFGAVVALSIVTTLITPVMLRPFLRRRYVPPPASANQSPGA